MTTKEVEFSYLNVVKPRYAGKVGEAQDLIEKHLSAREGVRERNDPQVGQSMHILRSVSDMEPGNVVRHVTEVYVLPALAILVAEEDTESRAEVAAGVIENVRSLVDALANPADIGKNRRRQVRGFSAKGVNAKEESYREFWGPLLEIEDKLMEEMPELAFHRNGRKRAELLVERNKDMLCQDVHETLSERFGGTAGQKNLAAGLKRARNKL